MPFDFNLLCVMQKRRKTIPFDSSFAVIPSPTSKRAFPKLYHSKWFFMSSCYGYWYSMLPSKKEFGDRFCGVYDMCHDLQKPETLKANDFLPKGLREYAAHELHQIVAIRQEYFNDFCDIIDFYLDESPVNMLLFLARCGNQAEGEELDLVTGVITRKAFAKMLLRHEVVFNMCYILKK